MAGPGRGVVAAVCLLAFGAVVAFQLSAGQQEEVRDASQWVSLEQEISTFGTAGVEGIDTDAVYDSQYQDDPGHTSRGELRFNEALKAAGGPGGALVRPKPAGVQWTAYPEAKQPSQKKINVNVFSSKQLVQAPAPQPAPHLGFTSEEANRDLSGYFDSIDQSVKLQEKKELQNKLAQVNVGGGGGAPAAGAGKTGLVAAQQSSLYALLREAIKTEEFQRDLVASSRSKFRGSLARAE